MPPMPPQATCIGSTELVQVQDYSNSFQSFIDSFKADIGTMVAGLANTLEGDFKYGLASFVDKPVPFLGYGWGDFDTGFMVDYCYQKHSPLTSGSLPSLMDTYLSGGNDTQENQFGAMLNAALDPTMGWSTQTVTVDGAQILKMMLVVTDAPPHGPNVGGLNHPQGGKWNKINNVTMGKDVTAAVSSWFNSYGAEKLSGPPNNPYISNIWTTSGQFNFHKNCKVGSVENFNYIELGEKIYTGKILSDTEVSEWLDVLQYCDPANLYTYLGLAEGAPTPKHPGTFLPESMCTKVEYPDQDQVAFALKSKDIVPIIVIPDNNASANVPYYQWAYGCKQDTEAKCVKQLYEDLFAMSGVKGQVCLCDNVDDMAVFLDSVKEVMGAAALDKCQQTTTEAVATTTKPTTPAPTTTTTPTTTTPTTPTTTAPTTTPPTTTTAPTTTTTPTTTPPTTTPAPTTTTTPTTTTPTTTPAPTTTTTPTTTPPTTTPPTTTTAPPTTTTAATTTTPTTTPPTTTPPTTTPPTTTPPTTTAPTTTTPTTTAPTTTAPTTTTPTTTAPTTTPVATTTVVPPTPSVTTSSNPENTTTATVETTASPTTGASTTKSVGTTKDGCDCECSDDACGCCMPEINIHVRIRGGCNSDKPEVSGPLGRGEYDAIVTPKKSVPKDAVTVKSN